MDNRAPLSDDQVQRHAKRRVRIACRQCRQAKIRCDLDRFPCKRCTDLVLNCTVDPAYKRSNKKDQVKELQEQVQDLQRRVDHSQEIATFFSPNVLGQSQHNSSIGQLNASLEIRDDSLIDGLTEQTPRAQDCPSQQASKDAASTISSSTPLTRTLNSITITEQQSQMLFSIYFQKFHPLLPILDPMKTEADYYQHSELLFWSIVATAARQPGIDTGLLPRLVPDLHQLLWVRIGTDLPSLYNIQSMLLLCNWPLPNMRMWSDKSHTLSSIAIESAMQMGMHRPGCEVAYSRESVQLSQADVQERSRTWIAIVTCCQCQSRILGIGSAPHFDDWSIRRLSDTSDVCGLPLELVHSLVIQSNSRNALTLLSMAGIGDHGIPPEETCFEVIAECERCIENVGNQVQGQLSLMNRIELLGSRLDVQCNYFLYNKQSNLRHAGILRAYTTASDLITLIMTDEGSHDTLSYAPARHVLVLFNAAIVILRVLHSAAGSALNYDHGRLLFNAAAFSMRQFSVLRNEKDQPIRASDMLRRFWKASEQTPTLRSNDLELRVKSRMGASLLYDSLLMFRNVGETLNNAMPAVTEQGLVRYLDYLTTNPFASNRLHETIWPSAEPLTSGVVPDVNSSFNIGDLFWPGSLNYSTEGGVP